jgi:cobalt/nickel transport system permease protein
VTAAALGRAFARGERTHDAMLARGFTGTLPLLHATTWSRAAVAQLAALVTIAAAVAVFARVG